MALVGRSEVLDARPPQPVVRVTNVIMRRLLRTPAGRLVAALAVLEYTGRRSGSVRRVVVGWHPLGDDAVVVTPASWRVNFAEPCASTVHWRGRRMQCVGTLETDPAIVATAVSALLASGTSARALALRVPQGHVVDAADITGTGRAFVRFARVDAHVDGAT